MKYDWKELNQRYVNMLKGNQNAIAIKFLKSADEIKNYPDAQSPDNVKMVCEMIGLAGYYNQTYMVLRENKPEGYDYCAINNGLYESTPGYESGYDLANPPLKWFTDIQVSKKHTEALYEGTIHEQLAAIVAAPIGLATIEEPDVIAVTQQPGGIFYFLSGMLNGDFKKLNFPFVGESSCVDTWGYTYNTGKPGISFGCRGDRCLGAMGNDEARLTVTPEDFVKAVDGMYRLYDGGVTYPFYPRWTSNLFQ